MSLNYYTIENLTKTDIYFNYDHDHRQIAQLEKWTALADKWFQLHGNELRKKFSDRWSGQNGRFKKEIAKLEKSFHRKCSHKAVYPQQPAYGEISYEDQTYEDVQESTISSSTRKRRSDDNSESLDNSGERIIHIIRNIEKWVETYIRTCPNSERIVKRWGGSNGSGGFVGKWERQITKNPIFQEQAEALKKRYFRNSANGNQRCGRIFREFGLHGHPLQLYDAAADPRNGIGRLGDTDFGNNQLMSMKPEPGIF